MALAADGCENCMDKSYPNLRILLIEVANPPFYHYFLFWSAIHGGRFRRAAFRQERAGSFCSTLRSDWEVRMEQKKFKTEVSQLLQLIIHSLYSNREIFLRELISNSSDALDKLKYLSLTDEKLKGFSFDPRIDISFTEGEKRTLTISDNGLGMNHDDLNDNLGTIASSGTRKFLASLTDEQKKDSNLIGQFGVGFYSAFMVSEKVEVISRKAGEDQAWKWTSDGKGTYTIEEATRDSQGSTITLYLNEDGNEYANRWQLEQLIRKYSDHIAYPIFLAYDQTHYDDKQKDAEGNALKTVEHKVEQINSAAALWRRSKSDLTEEDYDSFYENNFHDSEKPLFYIHTQAEGATEYITLFYTRPRLRST
jgi:molecular chaperone HtpG